MDDYGREGGREGWMDGLIYAEMFNCKRLLRMN